MTVAVLALAGPAMAINYHFPVTTTSDGFTAPCLATTNLSGPPADPTCTLREAIAAANAVGSNGFVDIPAGSYTLTQGELAITGAIHVTGAGARTTIISGNDASRIFSNTAGGAGTAISDLTVTHGHASSGDGGAIFNDFGTMALARVAVLDSTADGSGGGIANEDGGRLSVDRSLIARNTAANSHGGGIFVNGASTRSSGLGITNSTVTGNAATGTGQGGGIYLGVTGTTAFLTFADLNNDTIANNTGTAGRDLARNPGQAEGPAGNWTLRNSIVSKPASATTPSCSFQITAQNNDRVTDASCLGVLPPNNSTTFAEPTLQPLADNGGPTDTMAPDADNTDVIDNGDAATCTTTDQRGFARASASADTGSRCDIGAYESILHGSATIAADGPATGRVGDALTYHFDVNISGTTDDAVQARVTYTMPPELQLVSATAPTGSCSSGVCTLRVAGGQTGQVTLVAKPTATGHISVGAHLWTPRADSDYGDNDASTVSDISPAPPAVQQQAQQPQGEQQVLGTADTVDVYPPALTGLKLKGKTVRYMLSEPATLQFSITRKKGGRHGRTVTLTSFTKTGKAGPNSFKLGRKLKHGSYRLVAVATDAARNKSKPVSVGFRVK